MRGLMMDTPLSISSLIEYAALNHGEAEIVSRTVEGPLHRYGYRDSHARIQQLAQVLAELGIRIGDRVGTIAWNGYRHFELYFAISGIGAVCHTINPRLAAEQVAYIVNHAEDRIIFVDLTFIPLLESLAPRLPSVEAYVVMTDAAHMPSTRLPRALCYETLLAGKPARFTWPRLDENTACALCYTSGTTGVPKGVLYTHRSTILHALAASLADNCCLSARDTVLPAVPMFHVNAWGIPYACAMVGAKLVLPGVKVDGASLYELLESEGVTFAAAVPTVWVSMLEYLRSTGKRLSHLRRIQMGGAVVPRPMIAEFEDKHDVQAQQGWGMTETSPVATVGTLKGSQLKLGREQQLDYRATQGRAIFGVEMRVVDPDGKELPRDGQSRGELCVRGPWVLSSYYCNDEASAAAFDSEGWFHTGDVSVIDPDGYMRIVDRAKDVIKSGGEWISSIEVETAAVGHPDIAEAGVIAVPHPRWGERPLLIVVLKKGRSPDRDGILRYLAERLPKLALPDDVIVAEELPRTPTGKVLKTRLREMFKDYRPRST